MSNYHKIELRTKHLTGGAEILLDGQPLKGVTKIEICVDVHQVNVVRIELYPEEIVCQLDEAVIESSRRVVAATKSPVIPVHGIGDEYVRLLPKS